MGPGRKTCIVPYVTNMPKVIGYAEWVYKSTLIKFPIATRTFDTGRRFPQVHKYSCLLIALTPGTFLRFLAIFYIQTIHWQVVLF